MPPSQPSSSSAPPPVLAPPPPTTAPPSLSPTSTSSRSHTSPPMSSPSTHSPETLRQIAEARTALEASMTNIGSSLDRTLRSRAENLHSNQNALLKQEKDLSKATSNLKKETNKLGKIAEEGSKKIKELGNVQNWAEMLERDFLVLGETLRLANLPSDDEYGSWYSSEGEERSESDDEERMKRFVYGEHKFVAEELGESPGFGSPSLVDSPRGRDSPRMVVDGEGDVVMGGEGKSLQKEVLELNMVSDDGMRESQIAGVKGDSFEDDMKMDKGKGKEVEKNMVLDHQHFPTEQTIEVYLPGQQVEGEQHQGGSSGSATVIGSSSDPSTTSVNTAASAAS